MQLFHFQETYNFFRNPAYIDKQKDELEKV